MDTISLANSRGVKSKSSALDQVLLIKDSGATPAEKRQMLQALQKKMEGERVQKLMVSMNKVEVKEKKKEDVQTNEDGDTVQVSQAAQKQYEQSESSSSSQAADSSASSESSSSNDDS